jgi:hypothetical protein
MHDSNALTEARERRIDDRFQVREDGDDALIHHRFTLPKFFFGFRSAEAFRHSTPIGIARIGRQGDSLARP